jgi:hypothetical protein
MLKNADPEILIWARESIDERSSGGLPEQN